VPKIIKVAWTLLAQVTAKNIGDRL